ncbi:MAG TPA: hypothetical protein VNJ71_01650 [Gemmatimonadales bacterium]|nr:hypothetical protein [Gemmatimonadales bacterium]
MRAIVGVMGSGDPRSPRLAAARSLGRLLAAQGWIVLTGGRASGIMDAAARGAKEVEGSLTIGILSDDGPPSPAIDIPIRTGLGQARNNVNVLTSDVIVAVGLESPGTLSEVALAVKAAKPVVLLAASSAARAFLEQLEGADVHHADSPEAAVAIVATLLARR